MATILLRKHMGALRPIDGQGEEYLKNLKDGEIVRAEPKRARNPKQHALYWAAINLCFDHQDTYATPDQLHNAIKVALGYCDMLETKTGKIAIPKSIAFGNMPQDEFAAFFDRFVALICTRIMPNTDDAEFRHELEAMIGTRTAA